MKKEKDQKKGTKPDLKFKKEKVKDLDPDNASKHVKGGGGKKGPGTLTVAATVTCFG